MPVNEMFDNVFILDGKLATLNLATGRKVYDEELVSDGGREYRLWNPYRSKLAAAIIKRMKTMAIRKGSKVLYLGAATGTTSSHVSDIVGSKGLVYCVEMSERSMRELLKVCEVRANMLPIFKDAREVDAYAEDVGTVDVLYMDVSARDQAEILLRNVQLLKKKGYAYVAIKSQSITLSKRPAQVYNEFLEKAKPVFNVLERIDISPFDKDHLFVVLQKH